MVFCHANLKPKLLHFEIGLEASRRIAFKIRDVETVLRNLVNLRQECPRIFDGFFLCI